MQFTDSTKDYATEKEVKIDCPQILSEYQKKHGLEDDNTKRKTRKKTNTASKPTRKTYLCTLDHELFESYVDESNAKYFSVGQIFWNLKYRNCKFLIVDDENKDEVEKIKQFRSTIKKTSVYLSKLYPWMYADNFF